MALWEDINASTSDPATSTVPHQPIDNQPFQFRLRGLLWTMTLLAVVTAVATPLMRQWTESHWHHFGLAVLFFGLGALGSVVLGRTGPQQRKKSIRSVGTPLMRITTVAIFPQSFLAYLQTNHPKFLLAAILLWVLIPAAELHERGKLSAGVFVVLIAAGTNIVTAISWCFARNDIVLGPTGLVVGNDFHPWKDIRATAEDGCLRLALGKAMKLRLDLTPEELAAVEA